MAYTINIDTNACAAHGDCADIAPEIFSVDDVALIVGTGPDELALAAAQVCPSVAITLTDETGATIFP
jgi:ferredoxin